VLFSNNFLKIFIIFLQLVDFIFEKPILLVEGANCGISGFNPVLDLEVTDKTAIREKKVKKKDGKKDD